jgi:choloylglycine hydrolase
MKKRFLLLFSMMSCFFRADACTDFLVTAADGSQINGRSLDFGIDLETRLTLRPRGEHVTSRGPNDQKGMEWTSKYAYLAATAFGTEMVFDGLNEQGLSAGLLWLPGTEYQKAPEGKASQTLDYTDFGKWVLGNFATVAEVKENLSSIYITGNLLSQLKMVAPLHMAIHDAQGNNLVIEWIKGEMKVYDNPNGVLTNAPPFEWQLINLENYINLTAINASPVNLRGGVLDPTGQGSGLLGIPGDWTPPSRFVRIITFTRFAKQPGTALDAVNLAEHLMNTIDIPVGVIRSPKRSFPVADYTQWAVIKDLTNKLLYFRTYEDQTLKVVDLKRLNMQEGAPVLSFPIATTAVKYPDFTSKLKKTTQEKKR